MLGYMVIYKTLRTIESLALHERLHKLLTVLLYIPILHSITYNTIYRPINIYKGCYTVIYKTLKTIESLALHERLPKLLTVLLYIPILHSITYNTIYRPINIYKGCYTVIYKTLKTIESLALHERLPKLLTVLLYIPKDRKNIKNEQRSKDAAAKKRPNTSGVGKINTSTILESGWNLWVWLVGVVSRRWVWLVVKSMGMVTMYRCG